MSQAVPDLERPSPIRRLRRLWPALPAAALLAVVLAILFPWYAGVYQVERAGRILDSDPVSEEAKARLLRAVDLNPDHAQAYRLLAQLDASREDWLSASVDWARFVALRPSDPQGYWSFAAACEQLAPGDLGQASNQPCGRGAQDREQVLVRLWESAGQTAAGFVRAGGSLQSTRPEEAIAYYRRALLLDPQSAEAWSGLAGLYRATGEEGLALHAHAQVIKLAVDADDRAAAHAARGEILAAQGHWDEAGREMGAAVEVNPENGGYRLSLGWYLVQAAGDPQIARSQLLEAARLLPNNPWPHVHLSILAFAEEEYETALEEAHTAAAQDHELFWAWLWRGKALAAVGRLAEAEDSLRRAAGLALARAEPHAELGMFLQEAGRLAEAILELEKATQLAPGDISYRLLLAEAYHADGQIADAAAVYRRILEMDPGNSSATQALDALGH